MTLPLAKYSHNCSALYGKYNDTLLLFLPQELVDKILLYVITSSRHPVNVHGLLTIRKVLPYINEFFPLVTKEFTLGCRKGYKKMALAHRRLQWDLSVQHYEQHFDPENCNLPEKWHKPGVHFLKQIKELVIRKGEAVHWKTPVKPKYRNGAVLTTVGTTK